METSQVHNIYYLSLVQFSDNYSKVLKLLKY